MTVMTDPTQDAMNTPFTMPTVSPGTPVMWWQTGTRYDCSPHCGTVIRTMPNSRMIELQLTDGRNIYAVRHADDPKLVNPDLREDGCWDFTAYYKDMLKRMEAAEKTILELQDAMTRKGK